MDAFDADCLIYAAVAEHPLGKRVARVFVEGADSGVVGMGSVLLLPELLSKPLSTGDTDQLGRLTTLLGRLELHAVDHETGLLSVQLAANYRLKAADAVHLATAVHHGADRFLTNNRRDFKRDLIVEIDVVHPDQI
ncbi:MAG: PIN domain-containing protein [Nakamurella sp.]